MKSVALQDIGSQPTYWPVRGIDDDFYRNIVDNVPGAVLRYRVNADGSDELVYISDSAADLWGVPKEEALRDTGVLWSQISAEDIPKLRCSLAQSFEDCSAWDQRWRIVTASGGVKWLHGIGRPERSADGAFVLDALFLDVTELKRTEAQLRVAVATSRQGLWQWDPSTDHLLPLENWLKMTGYARDEVRSMAACYEHGIVHPKDSDKIIAYLVALTNGECDEAEIEFRIRKKTGEFFWALTRASVTERDAFGQAVHIIGSNIDISERKLAEEQLRIAASAFESHGPMVVTDPDARIIRVNQAFTDLLQYTGEELIGNYISMLRSVRHDEQFYLDMMNSVRDTGRWDGEIWRRRKDGSDVPMWLTITVVRDEEGTVTHHVANMLDISQRLSAEHEAERLAFYDALTGLPNRRYLITRIEAALASALRHESSGALLYLDLDHFKTINDSLGHAAGDDLLIQVATRLQGLIRQEDVVSRLGGDEFVVLIADAGARGSEGSDLVRGVATRFEHELRRPFVVDGREIHVTGTIGISVFPEEFAEPADYLRFADTAMYQGKAEGRNTHRFYRRSMMTEASKRLQLEQDLRLAISGDQFELHYQPQVRAEGEVVGAEVLLRWLHPEHGYIPPNSFIPVAEDCGLIEDVGFWVIENAFRQMHTWLDRDDMCGLEHLSINVSSLQFRNVDFVDNLQSRCQHIGTPPERIILELTERAAIEGIDDTVNKMHELRKLGFRFSLDDFGTGYSSLSYLRRLPLDQIKIDRSFVADLARDDNADAIAETIIAMGAILGFDIVAEGVETQQQREFLSEHDCSIFQGYLFCKPLPRPEFEAYCRATMT